MDFDMYRKELGVLQLEFDIMRAPLYEAQGIYDNYELDTWRKSIFDWLSREENEPKIINKYITTTIIEEFIQQMTEDLKRVEQDLIRQI